MLKIKNSIEIDGISIEMLKKTYGTPLYIYSVNGMRDRIGEIKKDFLNKYKNTSVAYAAKAFLTTAMAKFIKDEGLNLDVVSGGEIAQSHLMQISHLKKLNSTVITNSKKKFRLQ